MKVRFRQTGGFGGLVLGCDLDTATMSPSETNELLRLVQQANIQAIGEQRHPQGRDLLVYEIVLEEKGKRIKVLLDSMTTSTQIEPLLQFLAQRSHTVPLE